MSDTPTHSAEAVEAAMAWRASRAWTLEGVNAWLALTTKFWIAGDQSVEAIADRILAAEVVRLRRAPEKAPIEPFERPDKPGWWWQWDDVAKFWWAFKVYNPKKEPIGFWVPAVEPPPPAILPHSR